MFSFLVLLAFVFGLCFSQISISTVPYFVPTNTELMDMSRKLRAEDINKANASQITLQYQTHINDASDAPKTFFGKVDESLFAEPSYKQFIDMMNNFYKEAGIAEPRVSAEEEQREIATFLRTVVTSRPFGVLYKFLNAKKHPFAKDEKTFYNAMKQIWFDHYSRAKGKLDTSGFEHVFIGEEKNGEVSGLHNWVRYYMLERNASEKLDYKGFIIKRGNTMASLKFTWGKALKKSGSLLIGTSPEYDMALYTLCFLSRRGKNELCEVEMDGIPISITSFDIIQNGKAYIGTVYPSAGKGKSRADRVEQTILPLDEKFNDNII